MALDKAWEVLPAEFLALAASIKLPVPEEKSKNVGHAVAEARSPPVKNNL